MNFIVGFLIFHCEDQVAFLILISLIEDYNLSYLYSEDFPGLTFHCNLFGSYLNDYIPGIYTKITKELDVRFEFIISEYIFSMFGSIIPLKVQVYIKFI